MKDASIKKFDSVYGANACYYGMELRKEFTDFFDDKSLAGFSALDLGCGEGRYTLYLAKKGCTVLAVDRSSAGIEKLNKQAGDQRLPITARGADIEDLDFEENQFDIVVAATVLDHLSDDLRHQTIDNIKTALKPGGVGYINVFTESDPGFSLKTRKTKDAPAAGIADISDTAGCMAYYFKAGELRFLFAEFDILYYYEGVEPDLSHGQVHHHGWACLLARKPRGID